MGKMIVTCVVDVVIFILKVGLALVEVEKSHFKIGLAW
jgi:hypothetical protein